MMQKIFRLNTRNSPATWKDFMVSLTSISDHIMFPVMSFGQLSMTSFWILRVFTKPYFIQSCDVTILDWFSNRTGASGYNCSRKSNNWLDQWQSSKLGTRSQVWSFARPFLLSKEVPVLLLNQPINSSLGPSLGCNFKYW